MCTFQCRHFTGRDSEEDDNQQHFGNYCLRVGTSLPTVIYCVGRCWEPDLLVVLK